MVKYNTSEFVMLCDLIIHKIKSLKININYIIFGCKRFYHGFDFDSNLSETMLVRV